MNPNTHIAPSKIHGLGLFASKNINSGQRIIQGREDFWEKSKDNEFVSVHRTSNHLWCKINHSRNPNTSRKGNNHEIIFATRNIKKGEEITENYKRLPTNLRNFVPINIKDKSFTKNQLKKLLKEKKVLTERQKQLVAKTCREKPEMVAIAMDSFLFSGKKNCGDILMYLFLPEYKAK